MKGYEAAKLMDEGKKVRRHEWEKGMYLVLQDVEVKNQMGYRDYMPMNQMFVDGWELYPEPVTFEQAVAHMKEGGKAKRPTFANPIFIEDVYFFYTDRYKTAVRYPVNLDDIEATDWELL